MDKTNDYKPNKTTFFSWLWTIVSTSQIGF